MNTLYCPTFVVITSIRTLSAHQGRQVYGTNS